MQRLGCGYNPDIFSPFVLVSPDPRVSHSHDVKLSHEALPPQVRSLLHLSVLRENRDQGRAAPSALSSGLVYSKSARSCSSILCASGAHSEQASRRAEALFESTVGRLRWSQRSSDTRLCSVEPSSPPNPAPQRFLCI